MSAYVDVVTPGMQTTVQDRGRRGFQHLGIPTAGPMDPFSHRLANAVVQNPPDAATLEVTLAGPTLVFSEARRVAVAGAWFEVAVDGQPLPMATPLDVPAGATLQFGTRHRGARAYVAVEGGFDVPPVLGSRATHVATTTGGLLGRALRRGDRLPLGPRLSSTRHQASGPLGPDWNDRAVGRDAGAPTAWHVRVMPGPQHGMFVPEALESLAANPYHVSVDADRVGFRLAGPRLVHRAGADILSEATPVGSLQVPASGEPVLLMADRQTTGGYPRIATVITADIGVAGQAAPGDRLHFHIVDHATALRALVAREQWLVSLEVAAP